MQDRHGQSFSIPWRNLWYSNWRKNISVVSKVINMKLVAVQLVLIAALILTLNIKLTLGQNDVTLLENEEEDDNIIEKDAVSQYLQKNEI